MLDYNTVIIFLFYFDLFYLVLSSFLFLISNKLAVSSRTSGSAGYLDSINKIIAKALYIYILPKPKQL